MWSEESWLIRGMIAEGAKTLEHVRLCFVPQERRRLFPGADGTFARLSDVASFESQVRRSAVLRAGRTTHQAARRHAVRVADLSPLGFNRRHWLLPLGNVSPSAALSPRPSVPSAAPMPCFGRLPTMPFCVRPGGGATWPHAPALLRSRQYLMGSGRGAAWTGPTPRRLLLRAPRGLRKSALAATHFGCQCGQPSACSPRGACGMAACAHFARGLRFAF